MHTIPIAIPVDTMPELPRTVARTRSAVDALFASDLPFAEAMELALAKVEIAYAELFRLTAAAVVRPTRTVELDFTAAAAA